MVWLAVILVVCSAVLHASWNLFGKKISPTPAFFLLAFLCSTAVLTPIALPLFMPVVMHNSGFTLLLWSAILIAGIAQMVYCNGLAYAYAAGDMSQAYPLARAAPVLFVVIFSFWWGIETLDSWIAIVGIGLLIVGCFILPMRHLKDFRWVNYLNRTSAYALMAALGTTVYTFADKAALTELAQLYPELSGFEVALFYIWLEGVSACVFMGLYVALKPVETQQLKSLANTSLKWAMMTGLAVNATYVLVLWAMQMTDNVSLIVALRQLSIPIGAILGIWVFREPAGVTRWIGIFLITLGVMLAL